MTSLRSSVRVSTNVRGMDMLLRNSSWRQSLAEMRTGIHFRVLKKLRLLQKKNLKD